MCAGFPSTCFMENLLSGIGGPQVMVLAACLSVSLLLSTWYILRPCAAFKSSQLLSSQCRELDWVP